MSEANFPSGQWVGFYVYSNRTQRYLMDLVLEFQNGIISGEGADGIGMFGIDGRYYPKEGECSWLKTYFGRHSVEYTGFREQKGIWGTWTLHGTKGGFHIWPIGDGVPLDELKNQVEEEFPLKVAPQRPLEPATAFINVSQSPMEHFPLRYPGETQVCPLSYFRLVMCHCQTRMHEVLFMRCLKDKHMKRTLIIIVSTVVGLMVSLWIGFSCGVYYQARASEAFTANQILLVRYRLSQHEDPMATAKYADEMAIRWEKRAENLSFLEVLNPHNILYLFDRSGEKMLLRRNQEAREKFLAATNYQ